LTNRYTLADALDAGGAGPVAGRVPGVLVRHLLGLAGRRLEAWRETGTGDLYAVITQDARKLWRELEAGQASRRRLRTRPGKSNGESCVSNRVWCLRWKG
jgi:hypothetical protein